MKTKKLIIEIDENLYNFVNTKRPNGCFNEFDKFDAYDISKCIRNGIPLEDIKVEIQNTILEQAYEKGQIDALEKIRPEILKEMEKLKGNSGCDYFSNRTIDNCIGKAAEILDKHIKENEQ